MENAFNKAYAIAALLDAHGFRGDSPVSDDNGPGYHIDATGRLWADEVFSGCLVVQRVELSSCGQAKVFLGY
jgi:hypothetical protein